MVTLQILVLSFLVRIQVAQLKRLSSEGRFFVGIPILGHRVVMLTNNESRAFAIDASIGQCPILVTATLYPLAHTAILTVVAGGGYLILTARWLSRYEGGLLLGQKPCAFL